MKINKYLFQEFENQENKFYDEEIVESRIIYLESFINKAKSKKEILFIFNELKKNYKELYEKKSLRLIDYLLNKFN